MLTIVDSLVFTTFFEKSVLPITSVSVILTVSLISKPFNKIDKLFAVEGLGKIVICLGEF